ncbi:ATP synthase F1 subunit gamma [Candidatus Saccharibacteria bacterium]|nr:ATP synthase F1 subunit gamma [Candidatus Saccharibacteria bacterium]MCB9834848.1 ATP synthase F1 subunit gamma [Candidatus Nomurabacteria bacterium]
MATNTREIKSRIKSVKNIGKITKAMELVAATKMQRAQANAKNSRKYAQALSGIYSKILDKDQAIIHRYTQVVNQAAPSLIVAISSDRSLAGAYNSNLSNRLIKNYLARSDSFEIICFGKKVATTLKRSGYQFKALYPAPEANQNLELVKPIILPYIEDYLAGKYSSIKVVYTHFISTLNQEVREIEILPITPKQIRIFNNLDYNQEEGYILEPDQNSLTDDILGRLIIYNFYQAMVEAAASEYSARMVAMQGANKASNDLVSDLTQIFNQARQSSITQELSEITAAKLALE